MKEIITDYSPKKGEPIEINKLYTSDCIDLIKLMKPNFIDGVITSPPYNINRNYSFHRDNLQRDDFIDWQVEMINELDRVIKPNGKILYNFSYGVKDPLLPYSLIHKIHDNTPFTIVDTISWKKPNARPLINTNRLTRMVELIYVLVRKEEVRTFELASDFVITNNQRFYTKRNENFIEAANNDGIETPFNDSTFSTELVLKLLKIYFKKDSLIFDPFMGIGTTIRGCLIYGCNYIGSELGWNQSNYFNNKRLIAIQRKLPKLKKFYQNILED